MVRPESHGMREAVQAQLGAIESLVGIRPQTCPWRALYHPLVREVADISALADKHLGQVRLGADPPEILLDALVIYERCKSIALAHNIEVKRKESERKANSK
jgi:hypothetical protein